MINKIKKKNNGQTVERSGVLVVRDAINVREQMKRFRFIALIEEVINLIIIDEHVPIIEENGVH